MYICNFHSVNIHSPSLDMKSWPWELDVPGNTLKRGATEEAPCPLASVTLTLLKSHPWSGHGTNELQCVNKHSFALDLKSWTPRMGAGVASKGAYNTFALASAAMLFFPVFVHTLILVFASYHQMSERITTVPHCSLIQRSRWRLTLPHLCMRVRVCTNKKPY